MEKEPPMSLLPAFNPKAALLASAAAAMTVGASGAQAQQIGTQEVLSSVNDAVNSALQRDSETRALDITTCVETVTENKRNNGFLGIIGNSRRTRTTSTYNEDCGAAKAASIIAQMASMQQGEPDLAMYALVIGIYREAHPEVKEMMDKMLAERGTDIAAMSFAVENANAPVQCTRTPAPANLLPGTVNVRVTFNCKNRTAPAAPVDRTALDVLAAAQPQAVTGAAPAAAAPAPAAPDAAPAPAGPKS